MMGDNSQQTYAQIPYGYKKKNTSTLYDVQKKNRRINNQAFLIIFGLIGRFFVYL